VTPALVVRPAPATRQDRASAAFDRARHPKIIRPRRVVL
jgi:hypothetical protein